MFKGIFAEGIMFDVEKEYKTKEVGDLTLLDTAIRYKYEVDYSIKSLLERILERNRETSLGVLLTIVESMNDFSARDVMYKGVAIRLVEIDGKTVLNLISYSISQAYTIMLELNAIGFCSIDEFLGVISYVGFKKDILVITQRLFDCDAHVDVIRVVSNLSDRLAYDVVTYSK